MALAARHAVVNHDTLGLKVCGLRLGLRPFLVLVGAIERLKLGQGTQLDGKANSVALGVISLH